jgi:hypothetical protein
MQLLLGARAPGSAGEREAGVGAADIGEQSELNDRSVPPDPGPDRLQTMVRPPDRETLPCQHPRNSADRRKLSHDACFNQVSPPLVL